MAVRPPMIIVIHEATDGETRPVTEPRPAITNVMTMPHKTLF